MQIYNESRGRWVSGSGPVRHGDRLEFRLDGREADWRFYDQRSNGSWDRRGGVDRNDGSPERRVYATGFRARATDSGCTRTRTIAVEDPRNPIITSSDLTRRTLGRPTVSHNCYLPNSNSSPARLQLWMGRPANTDYYLVTVPGVTSQRVTGNYVNLTGLRGPGNYRYYVTAMSNNPIYRPTTPRSGVATCPRPNQAPNQPSITGPTDGLSAPTNHTFTFQATDPDGDNIAYEIDWDNNGSVDQSVGYVSSGQSVTASRGWAAGMRTFRARTVDTGNARSSWRSYTVDIFDPITLDLTANSGGAAVQGPLTIDALEETTFNWTSTNASACTGTNFSTSNNTSGNNVAITEPAPGSSRTYTLTCTGRPPTQTDSLTIIRNDYANLETPNLGTLNQSTSFDPTTGEYDTAQVIFSVRNGGESATGPFTNRFRFDERDNGSFDVTQDFPVTNLNSGQTSANQTITLSDVLYGPHRLRVIAEHGNAVPETDETDNVRTITVTLPPPDPGFGTSPTIGIWADRTILRPEETTTVYWNTNVSYPMNCTVAGPGFTRSFDPSVAGPTGSEVTLPSVSTQVYTLRCVEPITNTTFSEDVRIESVGVVEEI